MDEKHAKEISECQKVMHNYYYNWRIWFVTSYLPSESNSVVKVTNDGVVEEIIPEIKSLEVDGKPKQHVTRAQKRRVGP